VHFFEFRGEILTFSKRKNGAGRQLTKHLQFQLKRSAQVWSRRMGKSRSPIFSEYFKENYQLIIADQAGSCGPRRISIKDPSFFFKTRNGLQTMAHMSL